VFDTKAQERLGYYVYALFDPRDPLWPFYIGKGCGNRVFSHATGADPHPEQDEPLSTKLQQIAEIKAQGGLVIHKVIRFGLSEEEALKIEASLIDLLNHIRPDALTNQILGQGVAEGIYDAHDLATTLSAEQLNSDLPLLVIKIERRWTELVSAFGTADKVPEAEVFQATQGDWRLSIQRANKAACVLSVARGLIRAVFVPSGWTEAGYEQRKRMADKLDAAPYAGFVGKSVAHLFVRGSQNPIRYLRC
jgi:uncharacterized protein